MTNRFDQGRLRIISPVCLKYYATSSTVFIMFIHHALGACGVALGGAASYVIFQQTAVDVKYHLSKIMWESDRQSKCC